MFRMARTNVLQDAVEPTDHLNKRRFVAIMV